VIKKRGGSLIVIDGDTFWSRRHNNKIRIIGIDCPKKGEPGYSDARDYLYELLSTGPLRVVKKGIDKYGRIMAYVFI
jgi:micrococcal nuclease